MELGGKAANIVFDDAPLDQAVEGIVNGIYFNQGHVCCAGSRLLIQESVNEIFIRKLKDRIQSLILGDRSFSTIISTAKLALAIILYKSLHIQEGTSVFGVALKFIQSYIPC